MRRRAAKSPALTRTVTTTILALLIVTSIVATATPLVAAQDQSDIEELDEDAVAAADAIYVSDDGSAILAYENETAGEVEDAQYSADIATGLVNALIEIENPEADNVTGTLGLELRNDTLRGDADMAVASPELDGVTGSASLVGEHTRNNSEFTAEMDFTVEDTQPVTASTRGQITTQPDRFTLEATGQLGGTQETAGPSTLYEYTLTETSSGLELTAAEARQVSVFGAQRYDTRENASRALTTKFDAFAAEVNGSADVTLDSYEYTNTSDGSPDKIELEYTVAFTGVKDGVASLTVDELTRNVDEEFDAEQRETLRTAITDVQLNEVYVRYEGTGFQQGNATVRVDIENYEDAVIDYLDVASQQTGALNNTDVESLEQDFEARNAAGLQRTTTWNIAVSSKGSNAVTLQGQVQSETTNWDAYVAEKEAMGDEFGTAAKFDVEMTGEGESLAVQGVVEVERDDLTEEAIDTLLAESDEADADAIAFLKALNDSEVHVVKSDLVFGGDTVEVRVAGKLDDLSAFQNEAVFNASGAPPAALSENITHIAGGTDGNATAVTYYYVEADADVETYNQSALADADTEVYGPGTWDSDDVREMDRAEVSEYLGVTVTTPTPTDPTDADGTGFGGAAAVVAGLAAALLAMRRRDP